ncbi:MAG: leucine--tRNA ligase [Deltaproteobacteria bacterium]|nr:leucine--tRNA ligase [Deltaproteobacteria bacterium]
MNDKGAALGYDYKIIEKKWQQYWAETKSFKANDFDKRPKFYVLDMFPYPSGDGLHVGHIEGYTASDIVARYKRMQGFNVLHPMGWDAFGLPAEQYAIKTNTHPRLTTERNIGVFRSQMNRMGFSFDWDREVNTTDPRYYRWTQWIFLKLFERGLAYQSFEPVNWCPGLGTVLADEEVINGRSEVGDFPVEKRTIKQWVLKITAYAERLLEDLDELDWPESTKEMQRNWIGKSEGCYIDFLIAGPSNKKFRVFTTRHDTLFGCTFCVLAPEHPLIREIVTHEHKNNVDAYIEKTRNKSDLERISDGKIKTGVFTGAYAVNPANNKKIPIFTADYVLFSYGTGAVMGVPGHDERDHAFALKYGLEIVRVVAGGDGDISNTAHTGDGHIINSDFLDGLSVPDACEKMGEWLEHKNLGKRGTTFRLRDWIFSRQRYWGEPFPLAFDKDGSVIPLSEDDLPVLLPEMDNYQPTGGFEPPLASAHEWTQVTKDGVPFTRETNIMPQWAGSCWYYLRFLDPLNDKEPWNKEKEKYWMPVDLYVGGVEHANLHLLYARFWHKVLYDIGVVSTKEPFKKLVHQGIILGENGEKMSKSRGNVVNPTQVVDEWGADSLRLYEMFLGPLEQVKPWQTQGIAGISRFLNRVWRLIINENGHIAATASRKTSSQEMEAALAHTVKKVSDDTEHYRFNTAISAMMEFVNLAYKEGGLTHQQAETLVLLLSPFAPHLAEECWQRLGFQESLACESWPRVDESLLLRENIVLPVMINGKTRGTITVAKDAGQAEVISAAREQDFVKRNLAGKTVKKEIVVPGRVINFVIGE